MITTIHKLTAGSALMGVLLAAGPASGQSFNIDFGEPGAGPGSTYGGAGLPGVWNSIEGEHTPFQNPEVIYDLVDVNGNATGVTLHQFGGQELIDSNDPVLSGDDAVLLNDALVTHNIGLESCLYINGLQNGTYEVITYAWMPRNPSIFSRVRHDFTPGTVDVGGVWTGDHAEGTTYALHQVEVTNGFMGSHSGIPPLGNPIVGAALNGIQLRLLTCPGDVNGDGAVNVQDLVSLILAWGSSSPAADVNDDGVVSAADLAAVILAWGPC